MRNTVRICCLTGALLVAGAQAAFAEEPATDPAATTAASASASAAVSAAASAAEPGSERAREVLATQEGDVTAEKNLEEVFQSAEKQYSLLKSGQMALDFSMEYSYFRNDRIDISFNDSGAINRFLVEQDASHSFGSSFLFDYGVWNNLTVNLRLPLVFKFDSSKDVSSAALGDIALSARWQPFALKRGAPVTTLFGTVSTATGDSPYEINPNTDVSSGKGYYALSGGASVSKTVDPAVVFGSMGYTMGFDVTDLNQQRGNRILTEFHPGDSLSFSLGMAHSLSYDLSISASYQQSYAFQSEYLFDNGDFVGSEDSTSASLGLTVGVRMSPQRLLNLGFGFGLTPEASDVSMSVSLPIDISGLRK